MSAGWSYQRQRERARELAIWENADDSRHGTANGYCNLDCRCERCRAAWAIEHSRWENADPARLRRKRIAMAHARAKRKAS